jgi:hypothetical protein
MKSMKRAIIMLTLTVCWANARSQERGNLDAASIDNFEARVAEYVKLHNTAKEKLARLTPTDAPSAIKRHEHELIREIRGMRRQARQGDIFSAGISAQFRRLIGITMKGPQAARIQDSLQRAEPVRLELQVNAAYPASVPLQSTPPSLLMNLPKLPPEVDYRVVGDKLVLRDVEANLIVDFIPHAIP